jgi:hypothetical protein
MDTRERFGAIAGGILVSLLAGQAQGGDAIASDNPRPGASFYFS